MKKFKPIKTMPYYKTEECLIAYFREKGFPKLLKIKFW